MQITVKNENLLHLIYIYMYLPHLNVCYIFEILKIQDIQELKNRRSSLKKRPKKQSFLIFSEKDCFVFGITSELLIHLSKVIGQTFYFCQMSQEFYFVQIEN